jgi:uncharacterized membrane protein YgcG
MSMKNWLAGLAMAAALLGASRSVMAQDKSGAVNFGALRSAPADAVKAKALAWLNKATNNDAAKVREFEALWTRSDRSVLDNLADTFALANEQARALVAQVRDSKAAPPYGLPEILKEGKGDAFMQANLGLAVARQLSNNRVHEEALLILNSIAADQTIDPAAYLFHKAVAEHGMLKRDDASETIARLVQDAVDSPERYRTVGALMLLDMETWKKDLGNVARLMDNSERRLDVGRAGPETQKIQKEVIARLDELIKELENKAKSKGGGGGGGGGGDPNGGSCPDGGGQGSGSSGGSNPKAPMQDSVIALNGGSGRVDIAKLQKSIENWGKLPKAEQIRTAEAIEDLIHGLSPVHRAAFERYWEEINNPAAAGNRK